MKGKQLGANVLRTATQTVVLLDLRHFTDKVAAIESYFDAGGVARLSNQIQDLIDQALKEIGIARESAVVKTTGDGAILIFDKPDLAHRFGEAVHHACRTYNHKRHTEEGRLWFRVGVATGEVAILEDGDIAGLVVARASRLEGAADVGEIVVDTATYQKLSSVHQACYSPEVVVIVKHDEKFQVHRYTVICNLILEPQRSKATAKQEQSKANRPDHHLCALLRAKLREAEIRRALTRANDLIRLVQRDHEIKQIKSLLNKHGCIGRTRTHAAK